jgi:hypothetical protein
MQTVQLSRDAVPGMTVIVAGGPYVVAADRTISVLDSVTQNQINALGRFLEPATAAGGAGAFDKTFDGIDLSVATKQALFTCPAGVQAIVTRVVVRKASAILVVHTYGFGWDANADDVIASTSHGTLASAGLADVMPILTEIKVGSVGDVFGIKASVESTAITVSIDVHGYFVPA